MWVYVWTQFYSLIGLSLCQYISWYFPGLGSAAIFT